MARRDHRRARGNGRGHGETRRQAGPDRRRVGPCIAQDSYEVGPEFPAPFVAEDPNNGRYFRADRNGEGEPRWRFDLGAYVSDKLERLGLASVETLPYDTCADDRNFFSYRRSCLRGESDYGRGLSAIALAASHSS